MKSEGTRKSFLTLVLISALLLMPVAASAGVGDIISLLTTITGTLKNSVGQVLNGIESINTSLTNLQQRVVWPVTVINETRNSVNEIRRQFSNLAERIHGISANSATLMTPSRLEAALRSAQTRNFEQISASYSQVYSPLPPPDHATPVQRNLVDAEDAIALGSLKTATASDQASEQLLAIGDQLEQQAAAAAPGSAPMLTTQAQISNLQGQAMLHKMLAAELRQEAAKLAHTNALKKQSADANNNLRNNVQQIFNRTVR